MNERIVEAEGLVKRYGKLTALDGLDLVAEPGRVLAVLGPNGAGKTTFVRTIATLLRPDGDRSGWRATTCGGSRRRSGVVIGLAGQLPPSSRRCSGRENLEMVARLFGRARREAREGSARVLEQLGLAENGDRLVRTYSGGMRRKLDLGASLVGSPRLLLLDEPTTGLDPRSRVELWDAIRSMVERGTDVLLTTQYLDEADHLAGRVVIIDHGRAVATGTPNELKRRVGRNVVEVHVRDHEDLPTVATALSRNRRRARDRRGDTPDRGSGGRGHGRAPRRARCARCRGRHARRRRAQTADAGRGVPHADGPSHRRDHRSRGSLNEEEEVTMSITIDAVPRQTGLWTSTFAIARRGILKFLRTPQLVVLGTIQGAMFLLIFRYVFGGAIAGTGGVDYVDFLVPGFVTTSVLFAGMGAATAIAEDLEAGVVDRYRSLPIPRSAVLTGRALADTTVLTWSLAITTAIGFAVGFRIHGSVSAAMLAFGLCLVFGFAFEWVFLYLGITARTAQAAQGMALLVFPLTFVSSAYVPVETMPGWMQAIAEHQPITYMVDAVRSLTQGETAAVLLGHPASYYVGRSLFWTIAIVAVFAPLAVTRYRKG